MTLYDCKAEALNKSEQIFVLNILRCDVTEE